MVKISKLMKKRNFVDSLLAKLLLIVMSAFIPIMLFVIANNIYSTNLARQQANYMNSNTITLFMKELDSNLNNIERQISRLSVLDSEFRILESTQDEVEQYHASQTISGALSELLLTSRSTDSVFIYASESGRLISRSDSGDPYPQLESVRRYLRNYLESETVNIGEWFPVGVDEGNYFFRILKIDSTYIGAWVSMDTILEPFMSPDLVRLDHILFADMQGRAVSQVPEKFSEDFPTSHDGENLYIAADGQRYIYIEGPSSNGQFSLVALISEKEILSGLLTFRILLIVIVLMVVMLFAAIVIMGKVIILDPVNHLAKAMQNVQSGDWEIQLDEQSSTREFRLLNQTYNSMIREIEQLKINVYEEQLMKQKAELQFFQLQIRPHFLVNSLNIIFNLAQIGDFNLIKKLSHYLIRYFQYSIKNDSALVDIKDELDYVQTYLSIQKLRFSGLLRVSYEIDNDLLHYAVPPLSIQTFVENTIIYAMSSEQPVDLTIRIKTNPEQDDSVIIVINDSGPGFPKPILDLFSSPNDEAGDHIGISNVKHRLALLFGGNAILTLENLPGGGASVRMTLPKIMR